LTATELFAQDRIAGAAKAFQAAVGISDKITAAQVLASAGDARGAYKLEQSIGIKRDCASTDFQLLSDDPIEEIAARARGRRVVLLNEDHAEPLHRAFASALLSRLARDGFQYFLAETFSPSIELRRTASELSTEDGIYIREPAFAALARKALASGYILGAYEDTSTPPFDAKTPEDKIAWREVRQAQNIAEKMRQNPSGRFVVLVGHAHGNELSREPRWMAFYLAGLTGVDPLTIAQTTCVTMHSGKASSLGYVLGAPTTAMAERQPGYDLYVFEPQQIFRGSRPQWFFSDGRASVAVPLKPYVGLAEVEARPCDWSDSTIALDRVLMRPGQSDFLALAPGSYCLKMTNEKGQVVRRAKVNVP
jgi:hypothetical protein